MLERDLDRNLTQSISAAYEYHRRIQISPATLRSG